MCVPTAALGTPHTPQLRVSASRSSQKQQKSSKAHLTCPPRASACGSSLTERVSSSIFLPCHKAGHPQHFRAATQSSSPQPCHIRVIYLLCIKPVDLTHLQVKPPPGVCREWPQPPASPITTLLAREGGSPIPDSGTGSSLGLPPLEQGQGAAGSLPVVGCSTRWSPM